MTGNLELMMNLRNQQIKDANIQAAEDVGRKAELGWFDVEFTVYGCAYLDAKQDKRYYKVSTQAEDIYKFIEMSVQHEVYPSNVLKLTKKCAVPAGMGELMAQDLKKDLAQKLQDIYPKAFFVALADIAKDCVNNEALSFLWAEANALEGVFDEEKLRIFESFVQYAYSCRKIETENYERLLAWIKEEYKNMEDNPVSKDIFEKTLYGVAYELDGSIRYMENAQWEYIYEKAYSLEEQGVFVTPVFSKTYWYNYEYRLADVMRDFKKELRRVYEADYCEKIKAIRIGVAERDRIAFAALLKSAEANWGTTVKRTLLRYGHRWNVL